MSNELARELALRLAELVSTASDSLERRDAIRVLQRAEREVGPFPVPLVPQ